MTAQPSPRTAAGRALLDLDRDSLPEASERAKALFGRHWDMRSAIIAIEEEDGASQSSPPLDVERLQKCPSLMALLNRYGRFNEAWWDRLADEYAAASLHEPVSGAEPQDGEDARA